MSACVTRDRALCAKNSTFDYFDGTNPRENELDHSLLMTNPITGKGIQRRSHTPIMAPGIMLAVTIYIYTPG